MADLTKVGHGEPFRLNKGVVDMDRQLGMRIGNGFPDVDDVHDGKIPARIK